MYNLPKNIIHIIALFLNLNDLHNLILTNKNFYHTINENYWKKRHMFKSDLTINKISNTDNVKNWKYWYYSQNSKLIGLGCNYYSNKILNTSLISIKQVLTNNYITAFINYKDELYGCGTSDSGQLGCIRHHIVEPIKIYDNVKKIKNLSSAWIQFITNDDKHYKTGPILDEYQCLSNNYINLVQNEKYQYFKVIDKNIYYYLINDELTLVSQNKTINISDNVVCAHYFQYHMYWIDKNNKLYKTNKDKVTTFVQNNVIKVESTSDNIIILSNDHKLSILDDTIISENIHDFSAADNHLFMIKIE